MWVGTEHVLLAVADAPGGISDLFAAHGVTQTTIEAGIRTHVNATDDADRQALSAVGIDLDRVQESLGDTAEPSPLEMQVDRARKWFNRSRPPQDRRPRGQALPFTPAAKKALELALPASLRLRQSTIEPVHLALGVLEQDGGVARAVLTDLNVDAGALKRELTSIAVAAA